MGSLLTAASHFYIPFTGFFLLLLLYYSVLCPPLLPVLFFLLPDAVFPVLLSFPLWLVLYLPVYCYLRNHPFFPNFQCCPVFVSAVLLCCSLLMPASFLSSVLPFDVNREIPPDLYKAVAEILLFVYNLRNSQKPSNINIKKNDKK